MIPKGNHHDRSNEHDQEDQETESAAAFSDELIDQLLAQVQNKDAESILSESGLAGQLKKRSSSTVVQTRPPSRTNNLYAVIQ